MENAIVKLDGVESKIITLRDMHVILDSDVAELYGVETRRINEAVSNNPDKFPAGYIIKLENNELSILRSKFSTAKLSKTRVLPQAFTEKGLYMLATILKSAQATQTTLAIVETFAKIRELSRAVAELSEAKDDNARKPLMQKSGDIIADILGGDMQTTDTETTIEINFALMKFKHTVHQKKK
jgi:hypothetical protein